MSDYTPQEQALLLNIARQALTAIAQGNGYAVDLASLPPHFSEPRACFVTLYSQAELRGCTGTLQARLPLAEEVIHSTQNTALNDPRFMPVTSDEVDDLQIEVSVLSPSQALPYHSVEDLLNKIKPHGVTLFYQERVGTFLPQVWEKFDLPEDFLSALCRKMGLPLNTWQSGQMRVEIYSSEEFYESR